jgi:hypothetical protein
MKDTLHITCSIFREGEGKLHVLTEEISTSTASQPKVLKAKELLEVVEGLLSCQNYDSTSLECQSCRGIANLRKQTAELVIKIHSILGHTK